MPRAIEDAEALTLVLNYVSAWQLLHRVAAVKAGESILVHGAGGGVGTALLELARLAGVKVYGTASERKHELVRNLGAIPIDYRREDFVAVVRQRTGGGVDAGLDPIGGAHLGRSRRALRKGGRLVSFGMSSAIERGRTGALGTLARVGAYAILPGPRASFYGIGRRRAAPTRAGATRPPDAGARRGGGEDRPRALRKSLAPACDHY